MLKTKDLSCFKTFVRDVVFILFENSLYQKANDDLNNQASSGQLKIISVFWVTGVKILGSVVAHIFLIIFFFWKKSITFYAF